MISGLKFDTEHALAMYAYSHANLPAEYIYDDEMLKTLGDIPKRCHIYMIGALPKVDVVWVKQVEQKLIITMIAYAKTHDIEIDLKPGETLKHDGSEWYIDNSAGERLGAPDAMLMWYLHRKIGLEFKVLYIGQAYGKDGERNALDRLRNHEKLQEIALKGVGPQHRLQLLLIEVAPANQVITKMDPNAQRKDQEGVRLAAGLDKLFGTDEKERISLYEAAMIRYFQPPLNKEFKDSFPSTNMKLLNDCYEKDFAAVVAEFAFDDMPFYLCSEIVKPYDHHIAHFDLHDGAQRKAFFSTS